MNGIDETETRALEMTGGEALVAQLVREGVTDVFGIPGVQLDWATDALRRAQDKIRYYVPRHEQTTSYMADGYARTTGKVGVCMVVPGPGVLNASAGLATAYSCNSRVLCITGQIRAHGIGNTYGFLHEIPDQSGVLAGLTKWSAQAKSVNEIPTLVRAAIRELDCGRPRPVAIEIPPDVLAARADVAPIDPPPGDDGRLRPDPRDVEIAAGLLDGARFPVIYVGGGVLAANASPELRALAEKLDAPVVASENGRGGLSDHHPLSLNAVGGRAVFPHADVALIVGSRFMNMSTGAVLLPPSHIKYIYLNVDESAWSAPRPSGATIHADAKLGLAALADAVRQRPAKRAADVARVRAWVDEQTEARIAPQMAWVHALRKSSPENGVLVSELTQVGYVAGVHYPVYEPQTYIGHGYQGTLGYGFPASLGVAAGNPDRAVVSITGDGGFGWAMQELSTAARYRLNVAIVVFNDGAFGNVRTLQQQQFGASFADEVYNPRFDTLAAAFDVRYARVDGPQSLPSVLRSALAEGGPTLIEAPVGPMPNPWSLIRVSPPPAGFKAPPNPLGNPDTGMEKS
jgi:acetolactate synthase-1/2/3 large subunit